MAEGEPQQTPDVAHQAAPEANAEASGARPFTVAVVGGGPVGALTAIFLAKRGWDVHLFESRKDIRNDPAAAGRSINLALSTRGIEAMRAAGVVDEVMTWVVPMKGRMIHTHDGTQMSQAYSVTGEVRVKLRAEERGRARSGVLSPVSLPGIMRQSTRLKLRRGPFLNTLYPVLWREDGMLFWELKNAELA